VHFCAAITINPLLPVYSGDPRLQSTAIVIVTWNSAPLIERVLAAVERQTVAANRVLVIDNGSDDAKLLATIVRRFPTCELILLADNRGFAAANNIGIQRCKDMELVALLNPDAFPEREWLAALLHAAALHPECAAFASRLLNHSNPSLLDGAGDFLTIAGKPGRRGHGSAARDLYTHTEVVFGPCAAAALYRQAALDAVGGFDERFFCYVEDVDLAFRLLLAGHECRYVPQAVALHVGSASTGRRSDFSVYYGQRNLVFNYVKNMPSLLFWSFLLPHLLLNIIYLIGAATIGRGKAAWRAKRDAIAALPAVWQQRRSIQSMRRSSSFKILKTLKIGLW
jgi:GT2 family glycosyltransferase